MLMASISPSNFTHSCLSDKTPISPSLFLSSCSVNFQFQPHNSQFRRFGAVRTSSEGRKSTEPYGAELLRRPVISPAVEEDEDHGEDEDEDEDVNGGGEDEETMIDWEEQILRDTVPLVNFVRMILHSGKYQSGDRLSTEHERTILERLLPYHPEYELKIGTGVDYIMVGYHPDFEMSRCLFIVRKDGEMVDFSYWKCIKGLIRKNYPLYADTFIFQHFKKPIRKDLSSHWELYHMLGENSDTFPTPLWTLHLGHAMLTESHHL